MVAVTNMADRKEKEPEVLHESAESDIIIVVVKNHCVMRGSMVIDLLLRKQNRLKL